MIFQKPQGCQVISRKTSSEVSDIIPKKEKIYASAVLLLKKKRKKRKQKQIGIQPKKKEKKDKTTRLFSLIRFLRKPSA